MKNLTVKIGKEIKNRKCTNYHLIYRKRDGLFLKENYIHSVKILKT